MAKVRAKRNSAKGKSMIYEIDQLYASIQNDQTKLSKLYEKMIAANEKSIMAVVKKLDKIKQKTAKTKNVQGKKVGQSKHSEMNVLQKELDVLKIEKSSLENGYKKFIARLKVVKEFEKEWVKKTNIKPKTKKKKTGQVKQPIEMSEQTETKVELVSDVTSE